MNKELLYQNMLAELKELENEKAFLNNRNIGKLVHRPKPEFVDACLGEKKSEQQIMQEAKEYAEKPINHYNYALKQTAEQKRGLVSKEETKKLRDHFIENAMIGRQREEQDRER